jgi:hypothetical protein
MSGCLHFATLKFNFSLTCGFPYVVTKVKLLVFTFFLSDNV